jgi:plasmid stabilization system protein ParE
MSRTLQITDRAKADAEDIFQWLLPRAVQGAISWYVAFRQAVQYIADSPES